MLAMLEEDKNYFIRELTEKTCVEDIITKREVAALNEYHIGAKHNVDHLRSDEVRTIGIVRELEDRVDMKSEYVALT